MVTTIAFWDCEKSGQEFILPKLPGISQMDNMGISHKSLTLCSITRGKLNEYLMMEVDRMIYGSTVYAENFSVYPLSPTRVLICFSPYFRAFFPIMDTARVYPPLLDREQFDRHFFEPMRLELFRPCKSISNRFYEYSVKQLTAEEVQGINAMLLDMETEEFVFHDYNKIRDSFWYYDHRARFAEQKKHDFNHLV